MGVGVKRCSNEAVALAGKENHSEDMATMQNLHCWLDQGSNRRMCSLTLWFPVGMHQSAGEPLSKSDQVDTRRKPIKHRPFCSARWNSLNAVRPRGTHVKCATLGH